MAAAHAANVLIHRHCHAPAVCRPQHGAIPLKCAPQQLGAELHAHRPAHRQRGALQVLSAAARSSTVKLIVQGRNLTVSEAIKSYAEEKINKAVGSYEGAVKEVDVKLSVRGGDRGAGERQQKAEVTVYTLRNGIIRVEDVETSMYAALDLVSDKLARKMRKVKEKAIERGKWAGRGGPKHGERTADAATEFEEMDEADVSSLPPEILRTKSFKMEPMSVEEALDTVEALGHDFYIFRDSSSKRIQVLYKRKEGGYGLITPERFEGSRNA